MTTHHRARQGLLLLVDALQDVQADLGEPRIQATFDATIDALSHSLVDLADGLAGPSSRSEIFAVGGSTLILDAASCSAAAAQLVRLRTGVVAELELASASEAQIPTAYELQVRQILDGLISSLQSYAEPLDEVARQRCTAMTHRQMRAWHAQLQPGARLEP